MEKLLTRSLLSRNHLVNKKRRALEKEIRQAWREFNRLNNAQKNEMKTLLDGERKARRQDWMLGPLAPKRDVGDKKETFGAVDMLMAQIPQPPRNENTVPRGNGYDAHGSEDKRRPGFEDGEWRGEGLTGNLVEGDRVCVVRGEATGKIGKVLRYEARSGHIFVKGIYKVDMVVPPQAKAQAQGQLTFEQELPIPITHVRLVTTLLNTKTGSLKDVLVRHVYGAGPYEQRPYGCTIPRHTRYTRNRNGTSTIVPWPEQELERSATMATDTVRNLVEEVTYQPSINAEMPLEEGVIDELRSKYSKKRRDWDDLELLRKKMMVDARRDWFESRSQILSQPFWTKEYMARVKKGAEEEVGI